MILLSYIIKASNPCAFECDLNVFQTRLQIILDLRLLLFWKKSVFFFVICYLKEKILFLK